MLFVAAAVLVAEQEEQEPFLLTHYSFLVLASMSLMTRKPRKREAEDALESNSRALVLTNNLIPHGIYTIIRTVRESES